MDSDPHIVPTLLASLLVVATAVWALVSHFHNRPRRPTPAEPTMELGAEPPAIVDLITDGFTVTPEAVPATLVDLATQRRLSIEEVAGGNVIVRLPAVDREAPPPQPYERRVLGHLRQLAVDGVVPAAAMTTGPEGASKRWWRTFRREVIGDAQARGLSRARWTRALLLPVWAGVVSTGALLWLAQELGEARDELSRPDLVASVWVLAVLATAGLGLWSFTVLRRDLQRDTDAGLDAASRWLGVREHMATVGAFEDKPAAMVTIWDRHLAYAVALDLAPTVVGQLPLGAEDHRHGWSRATGQWRQIRVRYPWIRPGYGQHPGLALLGALAVGAVAVLVLRFAARARSGDVEFLSDAAGDTARGIDIAALVVGGIALVVLVWNVAKLVLAVSDAFRTEEREGVMVRTRLRRGWIGLTAEPNTSSDNRATERFFCALDTGAQSDISAWRVRRHLFTQLRQGDRYRVKVTPRLGYVRGIEPIETRAGP